MRGIRRTRLASGWPGNRQEVPHGGGHVRERIIPGSLGFALSVRSNRFPVEHLSHFQPTMLTIPSSQVEKKLNTIFRRVRGHFLCAQANCVPCLAGTRIIFRASTNGLEPTSGRVVSQTQWCYSRVAVAVTSAAGLAARRKRGQAPRGWPSCWREVV